MKENFIYFIRKFLNDDANSGNDYDYFENNDVFLVMVMMLAKGAMRCATLGAGRGMWHSERWHSFLEYHPHHTRYTHTAQPTGSPSLMIPNNHITNPAANQAINYYQPTK